ncbi:hypothetical protein GZH47_12075 [Paenibacillus rhizovicinus]|uniref:Tail specific protease domain-containing protein n=1 Tax=Paenibacillus rhizovicinus TaxID=2704463 RepID=A0A6C0NZX5_9BACL|nr:S41 family peptidase [Paenibacillus rhizovicinus]QHW31506.1 hypothetical protein GZH47_12075 [Paenibacillus rhizovicinus]
MQELSLEQRLIIVAETVRLTEKAFAHWENASIGPDELGNVMEEWFEKASHAERRADFQHVMWAYFSKLRNGHSNYFDRAMPFPYGGMLGLALIEADGEWVVNGDHSGLLKRGDSVLKIGGRTLGDWLEEIGSLAGMTDWRSNIARLPYYLSQLLPDERVEVEIMDQLGTRRCVSLPRKPVDFEALNQGETTGRRLPGTEVAYIRIPSFNHPKFEEQALLLLEEYRDSASLIIDVRGNGGGSTPGRLTDKLMDRPHRWWTERSRHPEFLNRRHPNAKFRFADDYGYAECSSGYADPAADAYAGRLILLADRFTGSAAEDFILPFRDNGRAVIVGERTFGSTGQPVARTFDNGNISVTVGAIRAFLPDGTPFEGVGIAPDIEISLSREDLYQQRDAALDKAVELLRTGAERVLS